MNPRFSRFDIIVIAAVAGAGLLGLWLLSWLLGGSNIVITNNPQPVLSGSPGALSGIPCEAHDRRPIAVMLSSDREARPLSGLNAADMVFEMPVTPNGITRLMAVYQCTIPDEIGSIRSARKDFIPLAQGIDAVLVHWGGEQEALSALDDGIMDNIDALAYEGTTFYRKDGVPSPHDGFTTSELLTRRASSLGYRATTSLDGYIRTSTEPARRSLGSLSDTARVDWPQGMDVVFTYDAQSNTYLRTRGGDPEIDVLDGGHVRASVVIVLRAETTSVRDQYLGIDTIGNGVATVWQGGQRTSVLWKKEAATAMLQFTDSQGRPVPLERGTVWILIDAPLPSL